MFSCFSAEEGLDYQIFPLGVLQEFKQFHTADARSLVRDLAINRIAMLAH